MNPFVIADAKLCIGCHACEIACVLAHNGGQFPRTTEGFTPRIEVVKFADSRTTALTCRHCEEAPCLRACPTEAIRQSEFGIEILSERCIGCKSCVVACPFAAIEMQPRSGSELEVAQKCDLCGGNPACVANCPTGALKFMTPKALGSLRCGRQEQAAQQLYENKPAKLASIKALHLLPKRLDPSKIPVARRKQEFIEIIPTFNSEQAQASASRCQHCGTHSVCQWRCPLHNEIPTWIELLRQGEIIKAAELSNSTNPMPEITGRICPQDRLCEGSCTLKSYGSVSVGNLERYITDTALSMGWKPQVSAAPTGKRVAIIGGGPAGLACADRLVRFGVTPVVFERNEEIGGLLTFGIPTFKLEKAVLERRRELLTEMGVEFRLNCEIGRDVALEQLVSEFDALFVGVGTYGPMYAELENEAAPGVYQALPYLSAATRKVMELPERGDEPLIELTGQRVVVLGGGDTAMDCVRTALRQGAESVTCAYRRDEANMPGSKKEVQNAKEEGGAFEFNVQPLAILLDEAGKLRAVRFLRTRMGEPDASGRQRPEPIPNSEFELEADALLIAFGFVPHPLPWLTAVGVALDKRGRIQASSTSEFAQQTSNPKIFAGGDAVRGADLVVTALAEGRYAAEGIMGYLGLPVPKS